MNMKIYCEPPKRNDGTDAKRWRGALFWDFDSPRIPVPDSVTFPICCLCRHVVWNWPHFQEEVPPNTICETCAEEERQSWNDDDDDDGG